MPLYESTAIVLRSMRLGEADKIVTFFTYDYGKLKAVAKGALKPKSRIGGKLEPLSHVNVILFGKENTDLYRLNSCDMIEMFMGIRDNYDKLIRACVSAELVDVCQKDGDRNTTGFNALLVHLRNLDRVRGKSADNLTLRLFEQKYLSYAGFQPTMDSCMECGKTPTGGRGGVNFLKGGVICSACLPTDPSALKVSMGAIRLIQRAIVTPMDKLGRLTAGAALLDEVERIVKGFIAAHIRRDLRSEKLLEYR